MGDNPNPQAGAEEAIAAVLRAERDAQEAVARCAAEAAALVAAARSRSEEIRARAERRIGSLRGKIAAGVERRIAALPAASASGSPGEDPAQDERLRRAAAALVEELTGASR